MSSALNTETTIEEIVENFSFLEDWEDRYGYLIELGRLLKPFPESEMVDSNKVQGCVSNVWLTTDFEDRDGQSILVFRGTSDAHIVRGLVAITLTLFSDQEAQTIIDTDESAVFKDIGLEEHLTPQRANGLRSMVGRIKAIAQTALS